MFFKKVYEKCHKVSGKCHKVSGKSLAKNFINIYLNSVSAFFLLITALLLPIYFTSFAMAQECSISSPSDYVTSPDIQLDITCPDAPFFKLSESPEFQETSDTGVTVSIDYIDTQGGFADVSIRYPNGSAGGNAIPFSVTEVTREVRVLVVLFTFGDGSLTPPSYATPEWAEKLVFSGDHDGRGLANSIKAHIEQNTYGKVKVSGEVYPTWVDISSIEKYRDLNLSPTPARQFPDEIVTRLMESYPAFFEGKEFDFLIALTPGALRATGLRNYQLLSGWEDSSGVFSGCAIFDIPVDSSSQVYDTIYNEQRVSTTDIIVVPRYGPSSVEGVWLAGDTAHTGTNYYTGGRVRYDVTNPNYYAYFIELGTPLPASNTEVVVTYYPAAGSRVTDEQMAYAYPSTLPGTTSFGFMTHELYHGMSWLLTPNQQLIGDLYITPRNLIENYGLMSTGPYNKLMVGDDRFYVPANLSAYSKVNLKLVQPFTLQYGENEDGVRLYRSEEGDFTDTNSRIKAIKVPLHGSSVTGYRSLVSYPDVDISFGGEEYLLLEWRHTGEIENGAYNFDEALPNDGLVIYRVIEGNPDSHSDSRNMVRIINATPVQFPVDSLMTYGSEEAFSLKYSPAPFGYDSDRYEYVADASWNWKAADVTTADFQLSPGSGTKTVYAKFMDLNGEVVAQSAVTIALEDEQNQMPVADAGEDQTINDDGDGREWVALDGMSSYDPDGTLVEYKWYESGELIAEGETTGVELEVGEHTITLVVFDDLGASSSDAVQVIVLAAAVEPIAPVADAGENLVFSDADMDGTESVLLDGSNSSDADGTLVSYDWYDDAHTLIAKGAAVEVRFELGVYDITLEVTDDSGLASSDSLVVEVLKGEISAPENLIATVNGSMVTLSWSDSGDNENGFYIERGTKVKNAYEYSRVATTDTDITSYSENLSAGVYYYRVQAFNSNTVSDYSETVSARIKK